MGIIQNLLEKKKQQSAERGQMGGRSQSRPNHIRGRGEIMTNGFYPNYAPANYWSTNSTLPPMSHPRNPHPYQQSSSYPSSSYPYYGLPQTQHYAPKPEAPHLKWAEKHPYMNPLLLQENYPPNPFQQANMYPLQGKPSQVAQKPSQFSSVLNQFKTSNGSMDYNKMLNTAGQMMTAVNQFGGLLKGFGNMFKTGG